MNNSKAVPAKTSEIRLALISLLVVAFCIFWKLGNFPPTFHYCVSHGLKYQVEEHFDHHYVPGRTTWLYQDSYSNSAGRSKLFGAVNTAALNVFGLTMFGIRFFPALLAFLSITLVYFVFRSYYDSNLATGFALLLGTSPIFLTFARSGSVVIFSISLLLLSMGCLFFYLRRPTDLGAVLVALTVLALPYGHTMVRPFPAVVTAIILLNWKRLGKRQLLIYFGVIAAGLLPQLQNPEHVLKTYFSARGESLMVQMQNRFATGQDGWAFARDKLADNVTKLFRIVFGLNRIDKEFWFPTLGYGWWQHDTVMYFRYLVPVLFFGIWHARRQRFWLAMLILSLIPALVSGLGGPSLNRLPLFIIPVAFYLAYGLSVLTRRTRKNNRFYFAVIGIIAALQILNYFTIVRSDDNFGDDNGYEYALAAKDIISREPQARIAVYSDDLVRGDFVTFRYYAAELAPLFEKGQIRTIYSEDRVPITKLMQDFDYFMAAHTYAFQSELEKAALKLGPTKFGNKRAQLFSFRGIKPSSN